MNVLIKNLNMHIKTYTVLIQTFCKLGEITPNYLGLNKWIGKIAKHYSGKILQWTSLPFSSYSVTPKATGSH